MRVQKSNECNYYQSGPPVIEPTAFTTAMISVPWLSYHTNFISSSPSSHVARERFRHLDHSSVSEWGRQCVCEIWLLGIWLFCSYRFNLSTIWVHNKAIVDIFQHPNLKSQPGMKTQQRERKQRLDKSQQHKNLGLKGRWYGVYDNDATDNDSSYLCRNIRANF